MDNMFARVTAVAVLAIAVTMTACGGDASSRALSVDAGEFDRALEECLIDTGIGNDPSENVVAKYNNDPVYRGAFENCVRQVAPDDAETILSVHMKQLESLPDKFNSELLEAIACVEKEHGVKYEGVISYREDRFIDFDAILLSFATDIEALEYWRLFEDCGGLAAPDVDPANFRLERDCIVHSHDGEPEHTHGNC